MMVDEADIVDLVGGGGGTTKGGNNKRPLTPVAPGEMPMSPMMSRAPPKRKPGPLPQHVTARRPSTPVHSPTPPPTPLVAPAAPSPPPAPVSLNYGRPPEPMGMWAQPANGEVNLPSIDTGPALMANDVGNIFPQVVTYLPPVSVNMSALPPVIKPMLNGGNLT